MKHLMILVLLGTHIQCFSQDDSDVILDPSLNEAALFESDMYEYYVSNIDSSFYSVIKDNFEYITDLDDTPNEFDKYLDFFERNIIIRPLFAGKLETSLSKKQLVEYALNHGTVTNGIISISSVDKLNELLS